MNMGTALDAAIVTERKLRLRFVVPIIVAVVAAWMIFGFTTLVTNVAYFAIGVAIGLVILAIVHNAKAIGAFVKSAWNTVAGFVGRKVADARAEFAHDIAKLAEARADVNTLKNELKTGKARVEKSRDRLNEARDAYEELDELVIAADADFEDAKEQGNVTDDIRSALSVAEMNLSLAGETLRNATGHYRSARTTRERTARKLAAAKATQRNARRGIFRDDVPNTKATLAVVPDQKVAG